MQDRELRLWPGLPMLLLALLVPLGLIAVGLQGKEYAVGAGVLGVVWFTALFGFVAVGPNEPRVVQLFGAYKGTLRAVGLFWGNPFYSAKKVTQRVRTFETGLLKTGERKDAAGNVTEAAQSHRQPTKVNDKDGTPIEIAAVVFWKVVDPVQALFQIDDYEKYVEMQSEAALRNVTGKYRYDSDDEEFSLRGHTVEVARELREQLNERTKALGIEIIDATISYLAYAPEIAAAMLQRQQAGSLIAARQKIVEGAVGMVEMALKQLSERHIIEFDTDRRAAMVSNLLVVLCGHQNPQPIVNTGTIYS